MKFEYVPDNEFEKAIMDHFQEDLKKRRETYDTGERIMLLEEMLMKNQTAGVMESMLLKSLADKVEVMWGEEGKPSIDQRIEILEKTSGRIPETIIELEQTKVRLRNAENDLRQALEKISSLEQSLAFVKCTMEGIRKGEMATSRVINAQADQLDRLMKEVFDEDPVEVDE